MPLVLNLAISIFILMLSSVLLSESIEAFGSKLSLSHSFTGAIISPMFTSLPELVVLVTSIIILGRISGSEIAAGTIIGEPFMVSSLGFAAMAISYMIGKNGLRARDIDPIIPRTFLIMAGTFPIMLIPALFGGMLLRVFVIVLLIILYILIVRYFTRHRRNSQNNGNQEGRKFKSTIIILISGIILLLIGSVLIVNSINDISILYHLNAEITALFLVPIGTIIPETMVAVIWAYKGKINLAIGALVGEEFLFTTIYPIIGILFTKWVVYWQGSLAVVLTSIFSILAGLSLIGKNRRILALLFSFFTLIIFIILIVY